MAGPGAAPRGRPLPFGVPPTESSPTVAPVRAPVRLAFVGLGRIYSLHARAYADNPDVDVVALVDPIEERRERRLRDWPGARAFASVGDLAASGVAVDAAEVLVPIVLHEETAIACLGHGWHTNLQKPMANDLAGARRMVEAARASGRALRVMENYLFYEPLRRLKAVVESGELGPISGYHLKMVASGRGGWDVPGDTYEWQFDQARRGRGTLLFDDGWHKLSTALWLFGPVREVRAWVGSTEVVPGVEVDAPTTVMWEHESGVRGVWDITLAVDMYLRSDYYTNDERWEVTGPARLREGQPVHRPGDPGAEPRGLRRRRAAQPPRPRRRLGEQLPRLGPALDRLAARARRAALLGSGRGRRRPRLALAAYESHARGGAGVDPRTLG